MARSLTVTHEEKASTSPLLTGFLAIAITWLMLSALWGASADAAVTPSAAQSPTVYGK